MTAPMGDVAGQLGDDAELLGIILGQWANRDEAADEAASRRAANVAMDTIDDMIAAPGPLHLPGRFTSWDECDLVRRRMIPACPGSGRGPSPGPGLSGDACPGSFHIPAGCDLARGRMIPAHRGSAGARPGAQHRRSAAPGRSTSHPRRQRRGPARHRRPRQPRQPER